MAQDPWAVVSTEPAPPPTAPKQPASDPWAVVDTKPVKAEKPVQEPLPSIKEPEHEDTTYAALKPHADVSVQAYTPTWGQRIRQSIVNSQPFHTLETYAPSVASALHLTPTDVEGTPESYEHKGQLVAGEYLTKALTQDQLGPVGKLLPKGTFREKVTDKPTGVEAFATGFARGAAGLTTPDTLLLMSVPIGDVLGLAGGLSRAILPRLVSAGFNLQMGKSLVDQWKERQQAKDAGNDYAVKQIDGEMSVTALMMLMAGYHTTRGTAEAIRDRASNKVLNQHSQDVYGADYADLSDKQKAAVIYNVAAESNPGVKARVDREMKVLAKAAKKAGVPTIEEVAKTAEDRQKEYEQRAAAAKTFTQRILARYQQEQAYKIDALHREQEARRTADAEEAARRADEIKPIEEQRGFPVEEGRTAENLPVTGLRKTTEREPGERYEPEPGEPAIPVTERRAAAGEPIPERTGAIVEAEARVQELSEQQFGQSFSSLPVYRQKVAAEWLAKTNPEAWDAFTKTPIYAQHLSDVHHAELADAALKHYLDRHENGDQETLDPDADIHTGTAKLIIGRTNIESTLRADPETARDLNEHTERFFGKSFDSLPPENRVPALAEYLRDKPDKLNSFMTVDLLDRMRTGQHIDLANQSAESMAKQRTELRMSQRDAIRRSMDLDLATRMVTDERAAHDKELSDALYASLTGRAPSLERVYRESRGLTEQAAKLGLGQVTTLDDLFRIEREAKALPANVRTGPINEFLVRMRQVRVAAESHVLHELGEATAAQFRIDAETATDDAVKRVAHLVTQAADLQQAADDLRAEGKPVEAQAAQQTAEFTNQKADAIIAGATSVQNPAPAPRPKFEGPIASGRETRVVSPANQAGLPAHYAVIEAGDANTSHHPFTYERREGYNRNGQPRDYSVNKPAQTAIETRAANLDVDQVLSSGVTTMEGPPIVDQNGDVISGNGRTLSILTALRNNPEQYGKYLAALRERAASYGIDPTAVMSFKNPMLVKVLDDPIDSEIEWARLGTELNRDPMLGLSESEQGVAMARLLSPEYLERLGSIVDSLPLVDKDGKALTVREALRARSSEIAQLMSDAGVISANKKQEFLDEKGNLNEKAKTLFENMMAGLTVTDPAVLERAPLNAKDKLARAGLYFIRMRNAGENWNLASMNTDALRLFTRAQDASARLSALQVREGQKEVAGSLVDRYLHPEKFVDSKGFGPAATFTFDGQPLVPPQHPAVEAMALAMEESPRAYTSMLAKYANRAEGMQATMFGAEHPADAFNSEIASKYDLKVIPEEWGMVTGLPETVKAAIEDSRGPLPVEPQVHAETAISDVTPDSTSVTDLIPEGPRTVGELRVAMANHPNLSTDEIDAANEILTNILPRIMGENLETLLGNRRLQVKIGGKEFDEQGKEVRGYHEIIDEASSIVAICDTGDISTWIHEVTHFIRRFLNPADQAVANNFVGAKPGEAWTPEQEEMFSTAHENYIRDGGIRRGKLEQVFAKISRRMQELYNAVTSAKLAKGSKELNAMFDNWYDWTRSERKPVTARIDVDQLASDARKVEIPPDARRVDSSSRPVSDAAQTFVFLDEDAAHEFLKNRKNGVRAWEMHKVRGDDTVYVRADAKKGKKLYQPGLNETIELAKRAKVLEDQLKRETDPRRQALFRGQLNGIEDKLRGSTFVFGGTAEPRDTSVIQLTHGLSETPTIAEPTTPAQAVTEQQIHGDPTAIEIGGQDGPRKVPHEPARVQDEGEAGRVPEQRGAADREPAAAKGKGGAIAKPAKHPLHDVKAAKLKAPERARGTPVVDPDKWREHVEALGLPAGTPPPTIRIDPDVRDMMIYPGQSEAIEGALSALQQYDATVLAGPTGSGKTYMLSAIANHLLGTGGDKVGLIVTRSRNLIHEADGYVDTARRFGLDVDDIPQNMAELQTGMYAATYAQIRGNRGVFSVPWDFVLFDESAEARNWTDSDQGKAVVMLGHAAKKVVYSSATPYSTVMELGYMHKLDLWPKGGFTEWAGQFGLREVGPNTFAGGTSAKKLEKLRQQLIERGQWQTLYKDMDGVEAHVALVPQTEEVRAGVRSIRAAFAKAAAAFQRAGMSRYLTPTMGHEAIYLKRYIEGARLPQTIDLARKAIEKGWRPVIFTEYRSPADEGMDFFHNLPGDEGAQINAMLPPLPDIVGELRKAFGNKISIFAGEHNQIRAGELEDFQAGDRDAIYMTYAAGAVGANAQDKVGDKPRMGIFLGLPWSGIMFEQGTGRTWRYGTKSNVANVFMTSDTLPEMKVLATKILPRMRSLKAAVYGEKVESSLSKSLRESVGIPQEMLEYEQGEEVKPQAAEFEQDGDGANYTHLEDLELPSAKDAMHRGMKYKGKGRLYQGPIERRVDTARRKRVAEMTPEEMREALLTSDVTKLPNARAFDEAERDHPAEAVAMSDADGLKAFNDKFGYAAGDELLKAKAAALREAGVEAYHEKGDEFVYRGKSPQELKAGLERARDILRNKTFEVTLDNGEKLQLKGVDFSYGTGTDLREAEDGLHEHKSEREARGERKRGELGGITTVRAGEAEEYPRAERREELVGSGRLYQGPKDEDPWQRAAQDAWDELMGRTRELPAAQERAITANETVIKLAASEAARAAVPSDESPKDAARRKVIDFANNVRLSDEALIRMYRNKKHARAVAKFVQDSSHFFLTSGDKAVEKVYRRAGLPKEGEEMKRRIVDFDIRKGLYQGRMQAVVRSIIHGNNLKPADVELMSKVVEGQASSDDPRITKAVKEFREFTASIRQALADAGSVVVIYEDGKRKEIPYSTIPEDPHYWPRMYDWQKPFVITDKTTGAREVHTLAEILNMPTGEERREKLIDQFAAERGISRLAAQAFFERSNRGIRLAGNVERAREWNIPMYGRDRMAIERYIDEVSSTLSATEVHGQFRQKTDPLIAKLNSHDAAFVNHVITSDLDPAHLPPTDRAALSASSAFIITGKMFYSPLKVATHLWKGALATDARSVIVGTFRGALHPKDLVERARDCNALLEYSKAAYMREYGIKRGHIGQKMLDFNGFTFQVLASRVLGAGFGRQFFEMSVYPKLLKDPQNKYLRWKLKDLYGISDEHIDSMIKDGYTPDDVRRMELGAANWITGSNRPSEMPIAFRADKNASWMEHKFTTGLRMTQTLHGFMFKTANLVRRAVFEQLRHANWKSAEPFFTVGRFAMGAGLAGFALEHMMYLRHKYQGSAEAEIEKHRHEWLAAHPMSAEALWWSLANISMAVGVEPMVSLFNELATHNPKDRQKLAGQHRFTEGITGMITGIPGQDLENILTAFEDMLNTFGDTGKHKLSPEVRRENILKRLVGQEFIGTTAIPGMKPIPSKTPTYGKRHRVPSTMR